MKMTHPGKGMFRKIAYTVARLFLARTTEKIWYYGNNSPSLW